MDPRFKPKASFKSKNINQNYGKGHPSAVTKKNRKWNPGNKYFDGSVQEGQGFAFTRKQKIQREYNKVLRKQRWKSPDSRPQLSENYPEHLNHLYKAELERLNEEELTNRNRRRKGRSADAEADDGADTPPVSSSLVESAATVLSNELPQSSQIKSSPHKALLIQKKQKKMSSYWRSKQEYERLKEEKERKREEYLKNKAQREEALKRYKEKKMATQQILKKKTKKGQPNLNLQMELLLQKIQAQRK